MAQLVETVGAAATGTFLASTGVTTATEWSSYAARWMQARVLSMRLVAVTGNLVTTLAGPSATSILVVGTSRSGVAPTVLTVASISALAAVKYFSGVKGDVCRYTASATDIEDQDFDPVGAMTSKYGIALILRAATAASSTATYTVEYAVEFRGPQ